MARRKFKAPATSHPFPVVQVVQSTGPAPIEPMFRLEQVLALLGCSRSTFYAGIQDKRFPEPVKNGRISLWPAETIRAWLADSSNFQSFAAAKIAPPRGIGKSKVFGASPSKLAEAERHLEVFLLSVMVWLYEQHAKVNRPSQYDVRSAAAVQARIAELGAGAPGSFALLKRWRPARK